MSSFDLELLRALGAADAALPPGPGVDYSPERLAALAWRRTARRLVAALATVLLVALGVVLGNLRGPTADAPAAFAAELAALRADLDRLQVHFAKHLADETRAAQDAATAAQRRSAASALRCDLAEVRADAALASNPRPTRLETRR